MRALIRKEWAQARVNVILVLAALVALWFLVFEDTDLLWPPGWSDDETMNFAALLALFAGLQLGFAQFASESLWKTRQLLTHRATGAQGAFRAKCLVGLTGATVFAFGPPLIWSLVQRWNSPWQHDGMWSRVLDFALVSTIAWSAWSYAALCSQLRHGMGLRCLATFTAGAGLFGVAALGSMALLHAPAWCDWLFPVASALMALVVAWCAGRAFCAGVDPDIPLRNRAGIALASGLLLVAGPPLMLVGRAASSFAAGELRDSFAVLAILPEGEVLRADFDRDGFVVRRDADGREHEDARLRDRESKHPRGWRQGVLTAFAPYWLDWGWPEPDQKMRMVARGRAFAFGGAWTPVAPWRRIDINNASIARGEYFEHRTGRYHVFLSEEGRPRHVQWATNASAQCVRVWNVADRTHDVLVDLERLTMLRRVEVDGRFSMVEAHLPEGDRLLGVERLVTSAWAKVGYRAPFSYENAGVLRGERGLYVPSGDGFAPYVMEEGATSVPTSVADDMQRYSVSYAEYDALDPTLEVVEIASGKQLFLGSVARPGIGQTATHALAYLACFCAPPPSLLLSYSRATPWANRSAWDMHALLGGKRPWLLALGLGFAAWLAWNVHKEARLWRRSPGLAIFWTAAVLVLGLPAWVLFRWCEPKPAAQPQATAKAGRRVESMA